MAADVPEPREFATLASVIPVGILRTDLEGRCFYISERVTDLTGLAGESALESGWEQCVHPEDREAVRRQVSRSEEHTSELQSHSDLVCRLLLEKKKNNDEMSQHR